ncbi:WD40 repeat-like protein [Backusella circina FSU 941]|nr:WD40 repeat-like protein [Backusella circina FSU 941]
MSNPDTRAPLESNLPASQSLSQADLDRIVASYLQKKGYKATETIFLRESKKQDVANKKEKKEPKQQPEQQQRQKKQQKQQQVESDDPDVYEYSYKSLREWIENSLDWYKPELRSVLFPIFAHSFLDLVSKELASKAKHFMDTYQSDHIEEHASDLYRLATVTQPQHVHENQLARMYRDNKYNLRMSGVPFELFLNYLQDNKFHVLLRIVHQYLNIQVVHGKLLKSAGGLEDDVVGITGHETQQMEDANKQSIQLGMPHLDQTFKEDVEQVLKEQESVTKRDENGVPEVVVDTLLLDRFKKHVQDSTIDGPAFGDIPLPPYRGTDIQAEIEFLNNINHRVPLGPNSLPSICCYTFHNTSDNLNCISVTKDATLIAGGFSESYIKLWSLKGDKLRSFRNTINPAHVNDYNDLNRQREKHGSEYKKLVGHTGPVYGLAFSHDNKYLVSGGGDGTARLWSTQTYTNLVTYRGHHSPIWDVDFGPSGFYFATASHDGTARVWSCDQIYPLRIFSGHLSDVNTVKFHPNSKYLATGSSDCTVRLWDIQKGDQAVRIFTGHTGAITNIAMSPNGKWMASAGEDKSIILWDLNGGKSVKKMTGHTDFIHALEFSADNQVLMSGGADCTVRIWDVNTDEGQGTAFLDTTSSMELNESSNKRIKLEEENEKKRKEIIESLDQLAVFPTKNTPIYNVQFTDRNLCLVSGALTL